MSMLMAHLPALQVVIPLLAAPIAFMLRKPQLAWIVALLATASAFAVSFLLLQHVHANGMISYEMGGWEAPWGIEYVIDKTNAFVLLIVSAIGLLLMPYAAQSVAKEIAPENQTIFYTAYLLCLSGLLGITATGDAFNVFVFLEISSLSSYTLISLGKDRRALTASFQYLVMGTIGATLILIGVGLLYMMTGTLNMYDLAERLPEVIDTRTVRTAFAFLTVGVCLKLALFPLHMWLPNAYGYAPSTVSAFLAATSTKVAIYVLLRFVFTIFGIEFSFGSMALNYVLPALAVAAIIVGSLTAIYQTNIKHLLAYASVAQIGYILLGVSLVSVTGLSAALLHIFNHAIIKCGLFLAVGCIFYRFGSARMDDMKGLGKLMPWTMAAIVAGGLSLIGVPLTVGFISKWYLVIGALERDLWYVAVIVLAGSLLAVAYIWKLVEAAYFQAPPEGAERKEAPFFMLLIVWAFVFANFYFGIDTDLTVSSATQAAQQLMGVAP